jgi:hypothetical protein
MESPGEGFRLAGAWVRPPTHPRGAASGSSGPMESPGETILRSPDGTDPVSLTGKGHVDSGSSLLEPADRGKRYQAARAGMTIGEDSRRATRDSAEWL